MGLRKRLALSSLAAIAIGLAIIATPTVLFPSQIEHPGAAIDRLIETPASTPIHEPKILPRESVYKSAQPSFMFEFNLDSSYGFERTYLTHETFGTPVFVVSREESATIVVSVSSLANSTLQLSLERIDGLPSGVEAELKPESLILQPNERRELKLEITISRSAPIQTQKANSTHFAQLVLRGDGYDLGSGFLLIII